MIWSAVINVALVIYLLAWSPFLLLIYVLVMTAILTGYYGRSDGRIPNP